MKYTVSAYENGEFPNPTWIDEGTFDNAADAISCAQGIIDRSLAYFMKPGTEAKDLKSSYMCYGEVPSIFNDQGLKWDTYEYVHKRIREMTGESGWRAQSEKEIERQLATLDEAVRSLDAALARISSNVEYVRDRVFSLPVDLGTQRQVADVCDEFEGIIGIDVKEDVRNLEYTLGLRMGRHPVDPGIVHIDPEMQVRRIAQLLWEPITAMHETVVRLEAAAKAGRDDGGAYLLVAESAVNILNAYSAIKEALATILTTLENPGAFQV
ncbi:MAG: hypothetical protein ABI771_11025 [Betaproteobacteria bacterium]